MLANIPCMDPVGRPWTQFNMQNLHHTIRPTTKTSAASNLLSGISRVNAWRHVQRNWVWPASWTNKVGKKMGISKNNGTPKSSILIGFSLINHPFWGTPIFGNTQISEKNRTFAGYVYTIQSGPLPVGSKWSSGAPKNKWAENTWVNGIISRES